jgi:hypothetical protein
MSRQTPANSPRRILKAGGPPVVITAGIALGATGLAGQRIESHTAPVARGLARTVGVDPQFGSVVLLLGAVLVGVLAVVVPGLFDEAR